VAPPPEGDIFLKLLLYPILPLFKNTVLSGKQKAKSPKQKAL
jgi:hypothetical protein